MSSASTPKPISTPTSNETHAVLVPGFWLGGWAWQDVEPPLRASGITTHAVTLPGLDGSNTDDGSNTHELTLDDHIEAVVNLIGALGGDIVLVGHSGGGLVVQGVIDRQPERIRRVVYVDTGPLLNGVSLMPDVNGDVPLPSWEELAAQNSSTEGMTDAALSMFRERAVNQPVGVARTPVQVTNDQRFDIPATAICTSIPSQQLRQMIAAGQIPSELASVRDVRYIDLPTGHWPMFSRPAELADLLRDEILRS